MIWFAKTYGWAPAADVQLEAQQTYQTELADYNAKAEAGTLEEDEEEPQLAPEMDRAAGSWGAVADMDNSILGKIGNPVSVVFKPLGFGNMPSTVATVMGLVAKEEVVGVLGVLYGADDAADVVDDEDMTEEEARALTIRLHEMGAKSVVVTSAKVDGENCVVGYDGTEGEFFRIPFDLIPVRFVGTGDIFAAVMLGRLVDGVPLQESTHRAMDAVRTMIDRNRDKEDKYLGIPIETCLEVLDE